MVSLVVSLSFFFPVVILSEEYKIAFGSCAKQYLPQKNVWEVVKSKNPDIWLWLGDIVYPNCTLPKCVYEAYRMLEFNEDYRKFRSAVRIDGVWDDHDYGMNDGDADYPHKDTTQQYFLDLMEVPDNSPLRTQKGLYHKTSLGTFPQDIDIIFLDTRYHRTAGGLISANWFSTIPWSSKIGAAFRWTNAILGIDRNSKSTLLGEQQWKWLEEQLRNSNASVTLLVSSIQVLTSIPVFESWGHYPMERNRLLSLIQSSKPKGVVILSGDVHMGQVFGHPSEIIEVTSSGLTHSIITSIGGAFAVDVLAPLYGNSVLTFDTVSRKPRRAMYEGRNFATLKITWNELNVPTIDTTIYNIVGNSTINFQQVLNPSIDRYEKLNLWPPLIKRKSCFSFCWRLIVVSTVYLWPPQMFYCLVAFYVGKIREILGMAKKKIKRS